MTKFDYISLGHPLSGRMCAPIRDWDEWCLLLRGTTHTVQLLSLLDCGFDVSVITSTLMGTMRAKAHRVLTYSGLADGHWMDPWAFLTEEERHMPGLEAWMYEDRAAVARRAFEMLEQKFFVNWSSDDMRALMLFPQSFDALVTFFQADRENEYYRIWNLAAQPMHWGAYHENGAEFALQLCRRGLAENWNTGNAAQDQRLTGRRGELVVILIGLGKLVEVLETGGYLWATPDVVVEVEATVFRVNPYPPLRGGASKVMRRPRSLTEALRLGAQASKHAAAALLLLRDLGLAPIVSEFERVE